jgi:hypothetical protein
MIKTNLLGAILCLHLVVFIEGSSCNNSKMKEKQKDQTNQTQISSPSVKPNVLPTGTWGGEHIALEATEAGATIDYDCAHGTITEKIILDGRGKFKVKGLHVKEHGGPVRLGEDTTGQAAVYTGTSDGKTLTLTVKLDTGEIVGTYTLTHRKMGRVIKCG